MTQPKPVPEPVVAAMPPAPAVHAGKLGHYLLDQPDPPGTHPAAAGDEHTWTCQRTECTSWVVQRTHPEHGPRLHGTGINTQCTGYRRTITNTDLHAWHLWPEAVYIQGGRGWASSSGYRDEWFFEACPPGPPASFLRTTGPSMREAETAAWHAWQKQLACPAAPGHGPFDRRGYTNGAAWCQQCGYWFNKVLPPTETDHRRDRQAMANLTQATAHLLNARRPGQEPTNG